MALLPGLYSAWRSEGKAQKDDKRAEDQDDIQHFLEWCRRRDHSQLVEYLEEHSAILKQIQADLAALHETRGERPLNFFLIQQTLASRFGVRLDAWVDESPRIRTVRTVVEERWLNHGDPFQWPEADPLFTIRLTGHTRAGRLSGPPVLIPTLEVSGIDRPMGYRAGAKDVVVFEARGRRFRARTLGIRRDVTQTKLEAMKVQVDEISW